VYLLASRRHGTLYVGVTNDLARRVYEHKVKVVPGFTAKYGVDRLVWFEMYDDPSEAIKREKRVKKWHRDWKIRLIEEQNPDWHDLFPEMGGRCAGHSGARPEAERPEPMKTASAK
jgi:putative endonuclease